MSITLAKYASEENLRCLNNSHRQETSKTPKTPKGDRFIPSQDLDVELNHYNVTKENSDPNADIAPEFTKALENTMFDGKSGSKILTFKDKAPAPKSHHLNTLHALYSDNSSDAVHKKTHRHIPTTCDRVLDLPAMSDDFYLNLVDWGTNNHVAIGLGSDVYLWNATTSEPIHLASLGENDSVTSVSWIKEGNYLAVGTDSGVVQMWDAERKKKVRTMGGHTARIGSLAWNSAILSTGSRDTNIINHDVRIQNHSVSTLSRHTQEVCGLRWSPDGQQLASGGNDNIVNIWDVNNRDIASPIFSLNQHTAAVKALAWCPFQSNTLATGGGTADRTIKTWNTTTGACLTSTQTDSQVCQLVWSTNYRELVSAHGFTMNQLTVWKYPSMTKVADLLGHKQRVSQLAISPDGETVVSGASDETLRFWKIFQKDQQAQVAARKTTKEQSSYLSNRTIR